MFLNGRRWYGKDGEQKAYGSFLILFNKEPGGEIRALVRHVRMSQIGHFMMGVIKIKSPEAKAENDTVSEFTKSQSPWFYRVADGHYYISLSGCYGGDGLFVDGDYYPGLWEQLHPLPAELQAKVWAGGGHNTCGSEGPDIHEWAKENINTLRRLRKVA